MITFEKSSPVQLLASVNGISGLLNFKMFGGACPQTPHTQISSYGHECYWYRVSHHSNGSRNSCHRKKMHKPVRAVSANLPCRVKTHALLLHNQSVLAALDDWKKKHLPDLTDSFPFSARVTNATHTETKTLIQAIRLFVLFTLVCIYKEAKLVFSGWTNLSSADGRVLLPSFFSQDTKAAWCSFVVGIQSWLLIPHTFSW